LEKLLQPNQFRPQLRLITRPIYNEIRQIETNFQCNFSPYSNTPIEGNEVALRYLSQLHLFSSSDTTGYIKGIYSLVQNIYNHAKFGFHFQWLFLYSELLLQLTSLPTGNDYSENPPTGCYLCCILLTFAAQAVL
jgi:hypothetical protein